MNVLTDDEIASAIGFGEYTVESTKMMLTNIARAIEAAILSKLAEQDVEPVAWMYEYSYDLNGDKQGNWPVEMHTHVSFSRSKPDGVASKLYTEAQLLAVQQRTAAACAKVCGEMISPSKPLSNNSCQAWMAGTTQCAEAIRNGEWRNYL